MKPTSLLSVAILAGVAACQTQHVETAAGISAVCPSGNDFVEVTNNTAKAIEIYADIGGTKGEYIGTLAPDSTHLPLRGTPALGKSAAFYAMLDGVKYDADDTDASPVQLIRRCGK